jgi:hypothetical protein
MTPTWFMRMAVQSAVGRGADPELFLLGEASVKQLDAELSRMVQPHLAGMEPLLAGRTFMGIPVMEAKSAQPEAIEFLMRPRYGSVELAVLR